ncbi:helix-turn-helix domain-containing protein [Nonomuraea sp. NPDC050478]|uniref:helix-turn-helix domain-containing protein n=1 Tax=Nonomuraea sp. NPDC050478 TaxID=3364365 RepID=UPI003790A5D8
MTPIYLSAQHPRWTPTTETDLQEAIDGGLLEESHHLDLKEAVAAKADNREAARDMASFAIDSGTVIIGIAEDTTSGTFTRAPQPLKGLAEKMEQIAHSVCDPPLTILTEEIPSDADPTLGYLVIHIPASPAAPHMVDGKYRGRGDKTKIVMSDADVVRLHERRRSADRDALALLQHEIDEDPIPADQRHHAHLFLVAQPLAGRRDMLLDLTSGSEWNHKLTSLIDRAYTPGLNKILSPDIDPALTAAGNGYRRARAVARATSNLGDGRVYRPASADAPEEVIELQVHEDGGLRLFFSRLSDVLPGDFGRPDSRVIYDLAAVNYTRRFLALVVAAAEEAGYFGNWALAFGATGLRGLRAFTSRQVLGRAQYNEDTYAETTSVSWAELNKEPGAVTRRLVGPLLRSFEVEKEYAASLNDPAPPVT